ncbi:MAG TPA: hypothetical protein VF173_29530 [Thermoanaerobaculia bacterium]|nr:hypothetical protein [Thermoanaerobaculia bacterium]
MRSHRSILLCFLGLLLRIAPLQAQAIIDNGTVQLGINQEGDLNLADPMSGAIVGLRYIPTNADATSPGCLCEGWGAADFLSSTFGFANRAEGGGNQLTPISFAASGTGTQPGSTGRIAESVVDIGSPAVLRVTQSYHPSVSPNLYEDTVTIRNVSAQTVQPRYRRTIDFDIEPMVFNEFITLEIGDATNLLVASDNGFASANPLTNDNQDIGNCGPPSYGDCGPEDHGAVFDFGFPSLPPGASLHFNAYFGAAGREQDATAALSAVGAEVFALGQPAGDPDDGTPNTFILGFSGVGGTPALPQCVFKPVSSFGRVGTTYTASIQVTLPATGEPLPGSTVTFTIVSGPHERRTGTSVTNADGKAGFTYLGTTSGIDTIEACSRMAGFPVVCCRGTREWRP